jgi:hypothetical protein
MISKGIVYVSFGKKSAIAVQNSYGSIVNMGASIPTAVIGDNEIPNMENIKWNGDAPLYNKGGMFLAGAVKPFLYDLSPFDYTLYLDADTTVYGNIMAGFDPLDENDICVANHYIGLRIGNVDESPEKTETINLVGNIFFLNSGVIFFRKSDATKCVFENWYKEWVKYGGWDEQMALHRSIYKCPNVKIFFMPEIWNEKYKQDDTIIWHQMGSQVARK